MTGFVLAAATWTCITAAQIAGPNESVAYACPANALPAAKPAVEIAEPPLPAISAPPKAKPAVRALKRATRHDRCGSKKAVWYTAKNGRRRYKCR